VVGVEEVDAFIPNTTFKVVKLLVELLIAYLFAFKSEADVPLLKPGPKLADAPEKLIVNVFCDEATGNDDVNVNSLPPPDKFNVVKALEAMLEGVVPVVPEVTSEGVP